MALQELYLPHKDMTVKMGRLTPPAGRPKLLFKEFAGKALPAPPASVDYSSAASASLGSIYLNNQLGDCVIAGGYHVLGTLTGNAGVEFVATDRQVIADYSAIGGYVPGRPGTDAGCNEQDALNYWTKTGFADGSRLLGWVAVDATDPVAYRQCLWLFENLMFGTQMPNYWTGRGMPQGDGFIWDVAGPANPNQGHCYVAYGYGPKGPSIDSWALKGTQTDAAVAKYNSNPEGGELYAMISEAMLLKGMRKSPNGVGWPYLVSAMNALGANIPAVAPDPNPAPPLLS